MSTVATDSILQSITDALETAFEDAWELNLEYQSSAIDFSDPEEAKSYDDAIEDIECRIEQTSLLCKALDSHITEYNDRINS